jgi:phytoene dehydrogenase-like protein
MEKPFVVVGGGLAGLTAAIALASKGHRVALYERSSRLGGRAGTLRRKGFALNFGPHALYCGGPAESTFRQWSIKFSGNRLSLADSSYFVSAGEKLPFISTLAGSGVPKLLATVNADSIEGSLNDWLQAESLPVDTQTLICALVRLTAYCTEPEKISARAAIRQLQLGFSKGVLYLDHGWATLADGLVKKGRILGIDFQANAPVGHIEPGVVRFQNGRVIPASGIVIAVDWDGLSRLTNQKVTRPVSYQTALLDLGLRRIPATAKWALGLDAPFYLSVHSLWASLAPTGASLVHVSKFLGAGKRGLQIELEAFADLLIPGWRQEVEVIRFLPRMVANGGVIVPSGRPDVDALGIEGVAICGDYVGSEGMLADASVSSALRAAAWVENQHIPGSRLHVSANPGR